MQSAEAEIILANLRERIEIGSEGRHPLIVLGTECRRQGTGGE